MNFGFMLKKCTLKFAKKLKVLLNFSTSYLCEQEFSTLANIKTYKLLKMEFIEEEMR
jgi:hypothetical protein